MWHTDTCPKEVTLRAKGRFQWPATTRGSTATVACPRNPDSVATRFCALDASRRIAIWDEPDVADCTMVSPTMLYVIVECGL